MTNLVEIRGLKVEATTDSGRRVQIIKGVDIDIAEGEIVALIGESGSGKTTIALTLMGYARPGCRISGGSVTVAGRDMVQLSEAERARIRGTKISYVPQSAAAAFNPAQKIIDQVIEVTRIHHLMPPQEARVKSGGTVQGIVATQSGNHRRALPPPGLRRPAAASFRRHGADRQPGIGHLR